MRVIFIVSTGGSVLKRALNEGFLAEYDIEVVSDRDCGAIQFANHIGIKNIVLESESGLTFSEKLLEIFPRNQNELFVSFYTRLLHPAFLNAHFGRVINFHPSILPACPGQKGFEDTINSGSMFIGSTVHFIDEGIDTGRPILQSAAPRDASLPVEKVRHRVFLQQVISLAQILRWFDRGLIKYSPQSGSLVISGVDYKVGEFSPNLDYDFRSRLDLMLLQCSLTIRPS